MTPPPRIDTARLRLDRWRTDDAQALRGLLDANDAHLRPWIPFMKHEPRSLEGTAAWLGEIVRAFDDGEALRYAIRERTSGDLTGRVVGETMLIARGGPGTLEAGYWLDRAACGRGYAVEATAALLPIAFDVLAIDRVILCCNRRNLASCRTAERLGAAAVGSEVVHENGIDVTLLEYELRAPR